MYDPQWLNLTYKMKIAIEYETGNAAFHRAPEFIMFSSRTCYPQPRARLRAAVIRGVEHPEKTTKHRIIRLEPADLFQGGIV